MVLSTAMDVVLEVFDTFLFDRLYASLLPASLIQFAKSSVKHVATSTFSSMREVPTAHSFASKFIQFEPSQYAYMSALPRDSIWRQVLSLYLITWYVIVFPGAFVPSLTTLKAFRLCRLLRLCIALLPLYF